LLPDMCLPLSLPHDLRLPLFCCLCLHLSLLPDISLPLSLLPVSASVPVA
jgi:hypothetical protein